MSSKQAWKHSLGSIWCGQVGRFWGHKNQKWLYLPSSNLASFIRTPHEKREQIEWQREAYRCSSGISCFLPAAGVSVITGNQLGVGGLAEILISGRAAMAHPSGGGAPGDPAAVQGRGWGAVGHSHFRAVSAGHYQHLAAYILPVYLWPKPCVTPWCHKAGSHGPCLAPRSSTGTVQVSGRSLPSTPGKGLKKSELLGEQRILKEVTGTSCPPELSPSGSQPWLYVKVTCRAFNKPNTQYSQSSHNSYNEHGERDRVVFFFFFFWSWTWCMMRWLLTSWVWNVCGKCRQKRPIWCGGCGRKSPWYRRLLNLWMDEITRGRCVNGWIVQ